MQVLLNTCTLHTWPCEARYFKVRNFSITRIYQIFQWFSYKSLSGDTFSNSRSSHIYPKKFKTEGLVRKCPFVFGPKQADTKGKTTPICISTGAFVSFHTSS